METKTFKTTTLSRLGYGCMRFPKIPNTENSIDVDKSKALIKLAYEQGVNYFDTAYTYHNSESEKFLSSALASYPRESYYLATKLPVWVTKNLEDCKTVFETQLKNLNTDYIDFYLLHALDKDKFKFVKDNGVYDYLLEQKKNGRIKNLGFSFHDNYTVLEEIVNTYEFDFAQIQFNFVDYLFQNAKKEYEILTNKNIPIMVMEPIRGGALANSELSKDSKYNLVNLAFRFVASFDNVQVILSGMSNEEQVKENLNSFSNLTPLSEEERNTLNLVRDKFLKSKVISCTSCNYCQPCTKEIVIPKLFSLYNELLLSSNKKAFLDSYPTFAKTGKDCIDCLKCVNHCPQKLKINKLLKEIDSSFTYLKGAETP